MLTFSQRVDAVVRDALAPHLKRLGFRKRRRVFRLAQDGHTRVVSINASGRDLPDLGVVGSYGVEIGIFFPDVFRIGENKDFSEPRIHECYVYSGLPVMDWGFFDDIQGDCPSIEAQTKSLENAWIEYGESWFDQYCDPMKAFEWAKASDNWKEALYFSIYLKQWDQAAECLGKCRATWGGQWLDYLEDIAERYGVPGAGKR